jgi:hypothetical protein
MDDEIEHPARKDRLRIDSLTLSYRPRLFDDDDRAICDLIFGA